MALPRLEKSNQEQNLLTEVLKSSPGNAAVWIKGFLSRITEKKKMFRICLSVRIRDFLPVGRSGSVPHALPRLGEVSAYTALTKKYPHCLFWF